MRKATRRIVIVGIITALAATAVLAGVGCGEDLPPVFIGAVHAVPSLVG